MDNYEWNHGMSLRFGLYAVDEQDPAKPRKLRTLETVYGEISESGTISAERVKAHPIAE